VPPTREQLIAAGKKAMAANDIEAANEIADMLDAMGETPAPPTQPRNMPQGYEVIERFPYNTFLIAEPDGQESLVTPGFVVSDPKEIRSILRPYRKAEELRGRSIRSEREKRRPLGAGMGQEFAEEKLERAALEQERIFEKIVTGGATQVLGRELRRKKPVSMMALQFLKGVPIIGGQIPGAITEAAAEEQAGGEALTQMGMAPRDITAAAMQETERTQPVTSGVAQLAGGLAGVAAVPGLLPALAARGLTAGAQLASGAFRGVTAAAVEGGATAAVEAPEGERLGAALTGAAIAAPIGLAGGLIPPGGAEIFNNARNYIARIDDQQLARELGVSRNVASEVRSAMASENFEAASQALRRAGADSMLADASPILASYLDAAIQLGGAQAKRQGRELVEARASVASQDFQQYMDDTLGVPEGRNVIGARIRLATQDERNDAYNAAYSSPIDYSSESGRRIESLLRRVSRFSPGSIAQANRLLAAADENSQQILANIAEDGTVTFRQLPDVRQIDYIRRALGDIVESQEGRGRMGGLTQIGDAAQNLSRQLRDAVAESVPEYRDALQVASSTIEEINAARAGANALSNRMTLEDARAAFTGMTGPERVAAQLGLRNAIEEQLSKVSRIASDPNRDARELRMAREKLSSRLFEGKLRLILGPEEAERFITNLEEASSAIELRAAIAAGSGTQRRSVIEGRIAARTAPGIVGHIGRLEPAQATKLLVRGMSGQTDDAILARQSGMFDEIAMLLTQRRGRQAEDALRIIQRAIEGQELSETQARIVARAVLQPAALTGATAGIQEYRYNPETDDFE
jgi:hypothetical protein